MVCPRHALTILAVPDLVTAAAFYRGLLQWPTTVEVPVYVELCEPGGRQRLGLYQRESLARIVGELPTIAPVGALAAVELYLYCAELDGAIARAESLAARPLSARAARDWGDEVAYFSDPFGNILGLASPLLEADPGIEQVTQGRGALCLEILRTLPDWFGDPESIEEYGRDAERLLMLAARVGAEISGFVSLAHHGEATVELHVIAVRPGYHRSGTGKRLVAAAERYAIRQGACRLTVKTLSAAAGNAHYDRSRAFYLSQGFTPIEEFSELWGPRNPCVLLGKPV